MGGKPCRLTAQLPQRTTGLRVACEIRLVRMMGEFDPVSEQIVDWALEPVSQWI